MVTATVVIVVVVVVVVTAAAVGVMNDVSMGMTVKRKEGRKEEGGWKEGRITKEYKQQQIYRPLFGCLISINYSNY